MRMVNQNKTKGVKVMGTNEEMYYTALGTVGYYKATCPGCETEVRCHENMEISCPECETTFVTGGCVSMWD